jgi:putative NAD(P)-binding protein
MSTLSSAAVPAEISTVMVSIATGYRARLALLQVRGCCRGYEFHASSTFHSQSTGGIITTWQILRRKAGHGRRAAHDRQSDEARPAISRHDELGDGNTEPSAEVSTMSDSYDAIIVGSGAGGAAVAYKLVRSGKRVLLLEKGAPLETGAIVSAAGFGCASA